MKPTNADHPDANVPGSPDLNHANSARDELIAIQVAANRKPQFRTSN